jgi:hypothetical protein
MADFSGSLPASLTTIPEIAQSSDLGFGAGELAEGACAEAMVPEKRMNKTGIKCFIVLLASREYTTGLNGVLRAEGFGLSELDDADVDLGVAERCCAR